MPSFILLPMFYPLAKGDFEGRRVRGASYTQTIRGNPPLGLPLICERKTGLEPAGAQAPYWVIFTFPLNPPLPKGDFEGRRVRGASYTQKIRGKPPSRVASDLRAENGTRTRDPRLGKPMLYQLSYFRKAGTSVETHHRTNYSPLYFSTKIAFYSFGCTLSGSKMLFKTYAKR